MLMSENPDKKHVRLHLTVAVVALVVVLVVLFVLSARFSSLPDSRIDFSGKSRPYLAGTTFVHPTLLFALPLPDSTWQIADNSLTHQPEVEDTTLNFMENIRPVVRFIPDAGEYRDVLVEVGVVLMREARSPGLVAGEFLQDIRRRTEAAGGTIDTLAAVTQTGDRAWFVLRFDDAMPGDVWAVTVITRGAEAFILLVQAEAASYNALIPDLTRLIEGFRFLKP